MLSFAVAVSLCFFVYKLFQKASYLVKFLLVIFFFVNINSMPDFYFSLLPSVAALVLLDSYSASRHYAVCVSAFGFTAALLLLIKLSFGMGAFIDLFLLSSFYVIKKDRRSFFILIASFFLSFVVLYIASGQKLSDIIYYPVNMYYGVAGYNDAMSAKYDSSRPVINSAVFLILFLGYIAIRSLKPFNLKGIFSLLIFALLFLIVFKHSYVRNDSGHHADMYLLMCFMLIYILHALEKSTVKNILITVCVLSLLFLGSKEYWYFFNGTQVKETLNN